MVKKGVPKEVLEQLDITKKELIAAESEVTAIVERHQVKLPIPSKVRRDLDLKKGQKLKVLYDEKSRTLVYKL